MLEGIDLGRERGFEIGALAAPIVTKAESDIRYVDWTDQQALRAKYASDPHVDVNKIVPVDAIWGEQTLKESFSGEAGFGYAIASHVIEHVPDMIGWLGEIAEVLRPGGRLTLAIPDRRFTFDYLRQETRVGDLIDAWLRHNRRPAPASTYDFVANAVVVDAGAAWSGSLDRNSLAHFADRHSALNVARECLEGTYHDVHCWVFTPESLFKIMIDLVDLDLLPFRCARFHTTQPGSIEMFLILERRAGNSDAEKAEARDSFRRELDAMAAPAMPADGAAEVHRLRLETEALRAKVTMLEAEAEALRSSTSWRITKPLRSVKVRMSGSPGG
jgi:SAM-dependent methyltransferase